MELTPTDRITSLDAGLGLGQDALAGGESVLATILVEELSTGQLDFDRLVRRWLAEADRTFACPGVAQSLAELGRSGAPPPDGAFGPGLGAAVVTLAAAARLYRTPRNLTSGVYHLARLLDPHPVGVYAAVAAAVAAARFLEGKRDFVPEVLDVLLTNEAPPELIAEVRRAPVWSRTGPPAGGALVELGTVFWSLHHFGQGVQAARALAPLSPLGQRLGLGLLGARQGHRAGRLEPAPDVVEGPDQ